MNDTPASTLSLLPAHADAIEWAAQRIVASQRQELPDLSRLVLILPVGASIARLRRRLTQLAGGALLGPDITTLAGFTARGQTSAGLSALDGELILADALQRHPSVFPGQDRWTIAQALFTLFEDLSTHSSAFAMDAAGFVAQVKKGYRGGVLAHASDEARMIHVLWTAYLDDTRGRSPAAQRGPALQAAFAALPADAQIWLIGFDDLPNDQRSVIAAMVARRTIHLVLQGPLCGHGQETISTLSKQFGITPTVADASADPYARAFDEIDANQPQGDVSAPLSPTVRVARAAHPEHEARTVDLAVRQALIGGAKDVVVVTQDRRLARRLRALLERAGVALRDEAGWALSTSAAASSLGHWLDCWQQHFPFRALLDLLRSDFYSSAESEVETIDALEALIYRHGVDAGLERLRKLDGAPTALLDALAAATRALPTFAGPARDGSQWSQALLQSLQALPLWQAWQNDAAGIALRRQLEDLDGALRRQRLEIDATRFRRLLERHIENATFVPLTTVTPVRLLTLEQAQGLRCETLVIAGASSSQFPGRPTPQGMFNHAVRAELGLPHWQEQWLRQLSRFRALLHAAPHVLITYAPEQEGEDAEPCPWVQSLCDSGHIIIDTLLPVMAQSEACEIACVDPMTPLPTPRAQPHPPSPLDLIPTSLSASAHQQLIDCPYQFFSARMLGLKLWQEPDEPDDRSDYGRRVHRILEAFHQQIPGLPNPFDGVICAERRDQARIKLEQLAHTVFATDLRTRAMARLWLSEFLDRVPDLVDWMIERAARWPKVIPEDKRERELAPGLRIQGRIDRLEQSARGDYCVVDYKTGSAPKARELKNGEAVQATHYALLATPCAAVEYLRLGNAGDKPEIVEGVDLIDASDGAQQRLNQMFDGLRNAASLPAQGDELTCSRCNYRGICRNGDWRE